MVLRFKLISNICNFLTNANDKTYIVSNLKKSERRPPSKCVSDVSPFRAKNKHKIISQSFRSVLSSVVKSVKLWYCLWKTSLLPPLTSNKGTQISFRFFYGRNALDIRQSPQESCVCSCSWKQKHHWRTRKVVFSLIFF